MNNLSNIDNDPQHSLAYAKCCGLQSKIGCRFSLCFDLHLRLWMEKTAGDRLVISWKLATAPQVKGVLLSENPMRGARAQDPPTDRVQTRVCRGLQPAQVCTLAPKGGNSIHTLCLSQRRAANDDLQYLEAIGSSGRWQSDPHFLA